MTATVEFDAYDILLDGVSYEKQGIDTAEDIVAPLSQVVEDGTGYYGGPDELPAHITDITVNIGEEGEMAYRYAYIGY